MQDISYLKEKRKTLLDELHSDEHYAANETIVFGDHDPLDVPIFCCDACGKEPKMLKVSQRPIRWLMRCQCGKAGGSHRPRPWQAALEWNSRNLGSNDYRDLPLFGLSSLDPEPARTRMVGIRRNVELRKSILGLTRTIAQHTGELEKPGKKFQERMEAYQQWSMLALRLIKVADRQTGS